MTATLHWTSRDLEAFPDDGKRYEIIDGELYMSAQPHWNHQEVCSQITTLLRLWDTASRAGRGRAKRYRR